MSTTNLDVWYVLPLHYVITIDTNIANLLTIGVIFKIAAMREAVGLHNSSIDILTFIDSLPSQEAQAEAHHKVRQIENQAMKEMRPQPGMVQLMEFLTLNHVSKTICTRNLLMPVEHLISNFIPHEHSQFEQIVTRDFKPTKPDPAPLLHIAKTLNVEPSSILMIGDSYDDMMSGNSAGCATILLKNDVNKYLLDSHKEIIDAHVHDLTEVIDLIENGIEKSID